MGEGFNPQSVFGHRLAFAEEFVIVFRLLKESVRLIRCARSTESRFERGVYLNAALSAISFESVCALRFVLQTQRLVAKLKPSCVYVTLEGHAFERLAFYAARSLDPDIKCFGYQHAILFPHQHSVKRPLGSNFDPDVIFTAGRRTVSSIESGFENSNTRVESIGTHRFSCPETIFDPNNWSSDPVCLVLPDGNLSECLQLCRFAVQAAAEAMEIQFVIRLHPLISVDRLLSEDGAFAKLPANLRFSEKTDINDDFNTARWTLYRGSGSVIHSVMSGCRPIYIRSNESINVDPLYEVTTGRLICETTSQLREVLLVDLKLDREAFLGDLESLFEYCREYFTSLEPMVLIDKLK